MKILTEAQASKIIDLAVFRFSEYIRDAGIKSIVLGVSGGIDSAVVGAIGLLTRDWLQSGGREINIEYMFLDVESNPNDVIKARELAKALNFDLKEYNLDAWYHECPFLETIPRSHSKAKILEGNIKCKLRMITLTHFANMYYGIYPDTDDLSEDLMGFFTRHGDEGDVKIIQMLTKNEVYDLGEFMRFPESILQSQPGDGLGVTTSNLATDQLGLPYMMSDYIMSRFIGKGFDHNGSFSQLSRANYRKLESKVAEEINQPIYAVDKILRQALKTGYKRRYGHNVALLLPNRLKMGLPILGTDEFNALYLAAIKKTYE